MYVNQQSSLAMPAPRAPMNQKIDTDNAMVQTITPYTNSSSTKFVRTIHIHMPLLP